MKRRIYLLPLLALALFTSCEGGDGEESVAKRTVTFSSDIVANVTRVVDDSFENANQIAVAAFTDDALSATFVERELYTYNSAAELFSASSPIIYDSKKQQLCFSAVYPAVPAFSVPFDYQIESDQSTQSNFNKSDLLVAVTELMHETTPNLEFEHKFPTLLVNITESDEELDAVEAVAFAKTLVECNIAEDSYTAAGEPAQIELYKIDDDSYKAVVAPQTVATGEVLVTLSVNGKEYSLVLDDAMTFEGGNNYGIDVKIENGRATFDTSINDWTDEEEIEDAWRLKDFSRFNYPTDSDDWVISNIAATTEEFKGLFSALSAICDQNELLPESDQRMINLSFPCLKELPDFALFSSTASRGLLCIESVDAPVVEVIGESALEGCENITSVNFPEVIEVKAEAMYCLFNIEEIDLPKCEIIGNNAFGFASKCRVIKLPAALDIDDLVFYDMPELRKVYISTESKLLRFGTEGSIIGGYWVFLNTDSTVVDLYTGALNEWLVQDFGWFRGSFLISDASPNGGADVQFKSITIVR